MKNSKKLVYIFGLAIIFLMGFGISSSNVVYAGAVPSVGITSPGRSSATFYVGDVWTLRLDSNISSGFYNTQSLLSSSNVKVCGSRASNGITTCTPYPFTSIGSGIYNLTGSFDSSVIDSWDEWIEYPDTTGKCAEYLGLSSYNYPNCKTTHVLFKVSAKPLSPMCSFTHYGCSIGTSPSSSQINGTNSYTWSCVNSISETIACSESKTGGSASSCGTANGQTFPASQTSFSPYTQCIAGFSADSITFPSAGGSASWHCIGNVTGYAQSSSCSASRLSATTGGSNVAISTVTNPTAGGSIFPSGGTVSSGYSGSVQITVNANYSLSSVSGCGGTLNTLTNSYTFGPVYSSCTITANFTATPVNTIPTITTGSTAGSVVNITSTNATSGGKITSNGGVAVTKSGIVWSTSSIPLVTTAPILSTVTTNGNISVNSPFDHTMSNLSPNTTYYVRAYATNSVGTGYGSEVSFKTLSSIPTTPTGFWAGASTCGTGQINLSWNASTNTTSYLVKDGTRIVYNGPLLLATDTSLVAGSSHTYTIVAVNSSGSSVSGPTTPSTTIAPSVCQTSPHLSYDFPLDNSTVSGTVNVNGWALDNLSFGESVMNKVEVFIDGVLVKTITSSNATDRGDVCPGIYNYSGAGCPNIGWNYSWDTTLLTNGSTHIVSVKATDSDSPTHHSTQIDHTVTISNTISGTLTPVSPTCTISVGLSSCVVDLTWTTTNPIGTSAITATGMTSVTGNSGTNVSFTVPYGGRTFYLYNNSNILVQRSATASCVSTATWDSVTGKCVANAISVSISATPSSNLTDPASTKITWTTAGSPTSCDASNAWTGSKSSIGGSENKINIPAGVYTYDIVCHKASTPDATATVTITVLNSYGSCIDPTTGTITAPSSATVKSTFEIRCDYGSANDYITVPGCDWVSHVGSAATFSCVAPGKAQNSTYTCTPANQPGFTAFCTLPATKSATVSITNTPLVVTYPPALFIDGPVNNGGIVDVNGSINIWGWAIDNDIQVENSISSVKIYVDGTDISHYVATATVGSRGDVCLPSAYPGRLGCPNVGWSYQWNSNSVTNGTHTIYVIATDTDTPAKTKMGSFTVIVSNSSTNSITVNKNTGGSVTGGLLSNLNDINCGSTCVSVSKIYPAGSQVKLIPHPDSASWKFIGWSGACSGTGSMVDNSCVVTVDSPKSVTAQFAPRSVIYTEF